MYTREHGTGHLCHAFFCINIVLQKWPVHPMCKSRSRSRSRTCDTKYILPCDISPIGAKIPLNESNKELRMEHSGVYIFIVVFSRLCNESRDRFATICLQRIKIKRTLSSIGKRPTTQIQVAAGRPG